MTATRATPGAIPLSNSNHLPPNVSSTLVNPVTLPPGRDRLATKPSPTGSETTTNVIGIVRVSLKSAAVTGVVRARITSGCSSTSSFAKVRIWPTSPAAHRYSNCTLPPAVHPSCWSPSRNAVTWACASASLSANGISTPMRRMRSGCCARAASGHAAAAPPRSVMNSRRRMCPLMSKA